MKSLRLFPNVTGWRKWPRRLTMLVVWPLVFVEGLLNYLISFLIDVYRCWFAERIRGEE